LQHIHREKQLSIRERQTALELELAQERADQRERWLGEPAQHKLLQQERERLRGQDRQLVQELQQERGVHEQVRAMHHELTCCPEQERALVLQGRSRDGRELLGDPELQKTIGMLRERRLTRERELARAHEIERRGITPLPVFRRAPQYRQERDLADSAWARHAAEKGLGSEQIRDELLRHGRQRPRQVERDLERITELAEREVKRARGLERDRGLGWSR
jgi:hypothetical protein